MDVVAVCLPTPSTRTILGRPGMLRRAGMAVAAVLGLLCPEGLRAESPTQTVLRPAASVFGGADEWITSIRRVSHGTTEPEPTAAPQIEYPIVPAVPELPQRVTPGRPPGSSGGTASGSDLLPEPPISRFRQQAFQGVQLASGVVGGGTGTDFLNITHVQVTAGVGIPLGTPENVLLVSPGLRMDYLEKHATTDLPSELYEPSIRFFHQRPIDERLSAIFMVTPSLRTDFTTTDNAFRIFGMAMLTWSVVPNELKVSAGVVYLDRSDIPAIPGVGLTWTPTARWKLDLQFPQPKLSYRVARDGNTSESWIYLAGGFGGNTWAVTRQNGQTDELTISDLRLYAGYEQLICNNRGWFVEAGWAFDRSLEYQSAPLVQDFSDAVMVRAGISF